MQVSGSASPGSPGEGNLPGDSVSGPQQEEEMEEVVVIKEGYEELLLGEEKELESGDVLQGRDPPGRCLSAVLKRIRQEKPRVLTYDEHH